MNHATNLMLDAFVHHYVSPDGALLVEKITQNWVDPIESVRMMITIFARYHSLFQEVFEELMDIVNTLSTKDLQRNKGGIAASLVFYAAVKKGRFAMSQKEIARIFDIDRMTIQNNRELLEGIIARSSVNGKTLNR
jgi:transcription initiation factor TFIIIB Brf1 subunit/transcription initiation factor TFIIB